MILFMGGIPYWIPVKASDIAYYETVYPFENQDRRIHPEVEHIPLIQTNRAISVARDKNWDRLIVHYTIPPFESYCWVP